jgi:uncharacterized protein
VPRVVHFEIHAEKTLRAVDFYKQVFDWKFTKWPGPEDYWLVKTGPKEEPGIDGGLINRRGPIDGTAVISYVCTVKVSSVDEIISKVASSGGLIVVPTMPIPGVGWLAYCKDTEGNISGIMEDDPSAK